MRIVIGFPHNLFYYNSRDKDVKCIFSQDAVRFWLSRLDRRKGGKENDSKES